MRKYILLAILILFFSGCAAVPTIKPVIVNPQVPGLYHKVLKGQTLWKISKIYGVGLDEIVSVNRISDVSSIELGQLIFIPQISKPVYSQYRDDNTQDFIWPVRGKVVSSFGQKSGNRVNKGLDIESLKQRDVLAASKGKVVFSCDNFSGFGKTLVIDHGNGFLTVYANNFELLAKPGDLVSRGAVIARLNPSGNFTYLHFEIRKGHIPQNPFFYLST